MNKWYLLAFVGAAMLASKKRASGEALSSLDNADLSYERLIQKNIPIRQYTDYGNNLPDFDYASLTLGYYMDFSLGSIYSKIFEFMDAIGDYESIILSMKPWKTNKFDTLASIKHYVKAPLRGIVFSIIDHESKGNTYAFLDNSNGTRDRGLGQLNNATIEDPSWHCPEKTAAMVQGQWLIYHPYINLACMDALLSFHQNNLKYGNSVCELLRRYAGGNQFFSNYFDTLSLIALGNDILKD